MAASSSSWRSSIGFSDRLALTRKIADAYQKAHLEMSPPAALKEARSIEDQSFKFSVSRDDHESRCLAAVEELRQLALSTDVNNVPVHPSTDQNDHQEDDVVAPDIGPYTNIRHHADGLFSNVYRAQSPTGEVVALKVTSPPLMAAPHDSEREARILASLHHPHIIPLLETLKLPGSKFALVFPFRSTDLAQLLRSGLLLSETRATSLLYDVFDALDHLHSQGIIHRDVKASNVLLDGLPGKAYLADFGIAWSPNDKASEPGDSKITDVGTASYRPPELLFGHRAYSEKLDIWAAGCVVAEAVGSLQGPLFDSGPLGSELALIRSIFTTLGTPDEQSWPEAARFPDWGKMTFHRYPPTPWSNILPSASNAAQDLISKLVCFESSARLTAAQAKSHVFFSDLWRGQ